MCGGVGTGGTAGGGDDGGGFPSRPPRRYKPIKEFTNQMNASNQCNPAATTINFVVVVKNPNIRGGANIDHAQKELGGTVTE